MACEHACGSTTAYAQGGSLWSKTFVKGACARPSQFNIFIGAITNMASTCFKADKGIMDALVHLRKKRGAGAGGSNCRRVSPGDAALG